MARTSATLLLACLIPQGKPYEDPMLAFGMELPAGWRQMTPSEARQLRARLPTDIATLLVLSRIDRFADVDGWLAGKLDGRCLTITREEGEPALTEATLQKVRETAAQRSASGGVRYRIDSLRIASVGSLRHPAIESTVLLRDADERALARLLEFTVPAGGHTLRFSFRADPTDFAAAEPLFRACAASLRIASPPEGPKELSDKLEKPLIIGALIGLILLVLYKMRQR